MEKVQFHRVAVGNHLMLGGDNLDLALAHFLEGKLGKKLSPREWGILVRIARQVKENLLGENPPESWTVTLPGSSSKLIGGGVRVEVTRGEVETLLVEGFFPKVGLGEKPAVRRSGFQEFGLPYAPDSGMTRYLADFLSTHRFAGEEVSQHVAAGKDDPARPDVVLFNGGLFESPALRRRMVETLSGWFSGGDPGDGKAAWEPKILENDRLDLAVSRGATYYGLVRRGRGVRIAAGLARTYYVGVHTEGAPLTLCLIPAKAVPGEDVVMPQRTFRLKVGAPVEFPLYVSSVRLTDVPGEVVAYDPQQMTVLPPIRTILKKRRAAGAAVAEEEVRIQLHARLTEIGTLELWCDEMLPETEKRKKPQRWQLEFDVRSATQTEVAAHESRAEAEGVVDEETWDVCVRVLDAVFSLEVAPENRIKPAKMMDALKRETQMGRGNMPASLLRRVWAKMMELEKGRELSAEHETRWLNLLGFALRPGVGYAMDDWRVAETWKRVQGKLVFPGVAVRTQWWILWRRIAGGLNAGQQISLAQPLLSPLKSLHHHLLTGRGKVDFHFQGQETDEIFRMLGSLELLPAEEKRTLGEMLLDMYGRKRFEPHQAVMAWTLGRLGARTLLGATLDTVIPAAAAEAWCEKMMALFAEGAKKASRGLTPGEFLAVMQLTRRTGDRYRDVTDAFRTKTLRWLRDFSATDHILELVEQGGALSETERGDVFGESLPPALGMEW